MFAWGFRIGCLVGLLGLAGGPAAANDSQAAFGLGGLTLVHSADIRMDSEVLSISEERITVDYVFTNASSRDVDTLVAFPLPDVDNGIEVFTPDYVNELDFRTVIDGQPAALELVQIARFGGRDITARLQRLGVPPMPVGTFDAAINALDPATRQAMIAEGLIEEYGSDGKQTLWAAHWTTATSVTRRQIFPAGRSVSVSHSYKPFTGGSVGGRLEPDNRKTREFAEARTKYCIDDAFIQGFDRKRAAAAKTGSYHGETWISYVLTSGANWKGPIGQFRMIVDKGHPDALISYCATGVRKTGPTRFEVAYQNYVPRQDIHILIVKFHQDP